MLTRCSFIVSLIAMAAIAFPALGHSEDCGQQPGYAYCGTRTATQLSPTLAVGVIGVVAVIVIAIKGFNHQRADSHSHQ